MFNEKKKYAQYKKNKNNFSLIIFQVSDIARIHNNMCPKTQQKHIQLSCDGVSESKSTKISIDVYSLCFKNCSTIYPHKLVRPLSKEKMDTRKTLRGVFDDIASNEYIIKQYIADNLKRAQVKEIKCHSGWYACEYCYAKGTKIDLTQNSTARTRISRQKQLVEEKIAQCQREQGSDENNDKIASLLSLKKELQKSLNALKRKSNILWPYSTMQAEHRSRASILEIVEKIEQSGPLSIDECKGIMGRSLLLDIHYFNYVYDVPAEYLHSGCLGVIKRLVEMTFQVGAKKRPRNTKRKLTSPDTFDKLMLQTKVAKEFPRRARKLDLSVFKGQEFRNLSIFYFVLIIDCIENGEKERNLWLYMAYMVRSCVIPTEEFNEVLISDVNDCCYKFYKTFQDLFGEQNCVYNLHVFCGHLMEIRTHGPLTETSAFKFESFYGEMRRSFVPSTISPLKQIMKKVFLKRALRHHSCESKIFISNYETALESNNVIYCFKNKKHQIYEVSEVHDDFVTCHKIGQYPASFQETPNLNWASVGVFRKGGTSAECQKIKTNDIHGKALTVGKYIITCPNNVLREK